LKLVIRDQGCK